MKRYILGISAVLLAALLISAAFTFTRPYTYHGSLIEPPYAAPDFTLPGKDGAFHLADQSDRVVLVFFGFTHCHDVCPTTLASYNQIHDRLGADADRVKFVFITVDPDRDTPEVTGRYAAGFNPSFIGLSGTEQELAPVWKDYGVYRKIVKDSAGATMANHGQTSGGHDMSYKVEHSSQTYLIDPSGNLRLTYSYGAPIDDILQDIRYLLK